MHSGRARAGVNNRAYVLAAQRRSKPARNQSVHHLHTRDVTRIRHNLEERRIERQRALMLRKFDGACLPEQLRSLPVVSIWITGVHTIHVLHDRESRSTQRVGEQKCAGVGPVQRDARGRDLMMVIRRKGARHDRARRGEVNRELARDSGVLDIGDALRCKQIR